ncbi:MAG TPA: hypothetical protein VGG19_16620 [Tepidisphaeraceae bacterium]|jgi:prepilin-type processing-associated H-X9-DG protein
MADLPRETNRPPQKSHVSMRVAGWILAIIAVIILVHSMIPQFGIPPEHDHRIQCGSQLRTLGQAMVMYANQHDGHFPENAKALLKYMSDGADFKKAATCFVCPSTKDTPADNVSSLTAGGHCSYIYLAGALTTACSPDVVLMYEPLTNHQGDGGNFLFADTHVDFDGKTLAEKMIRELQAGENPPPSAN